MRSLLEELPTPCLLLDERVLHRNLDAMRRLMKAVGDGFRLHVKTTKCVEVAQQYFEGQPGPIAVSTVREAEYFADHGFNDIVYAVGVDPTKLPRIRALKQRGVRLRMLLDSIETARSVCAFGESVNEIFDVLVEISCDGSRAGVAPHDREMLDIARLLTGSGHTRFSGLLTHAGSSYGAASIDEIRSIAMKEVRAVKDCAARLRREGLNCELLSVGSTPTAKFSEKGSGGIERRAGVFAFNDLFQVGLGVCRLEDIALTVLATVIGHRRETGQAIVDAGALALSQDHGTATQKMDRGYGLVVNGAGSIDNLELEVIVQSINQEHGILGARGGSMNPDRYPVGSRVRILPSHACITAACHDGYHVVGPDGLVRDWWQRCRGW